MKIFQCTTLYSGYLLRLEKLAASTRTFAERQDVFLQDRHGAGHFLKPVLEREACAFQANANDLTHQRMWASEKGLPSGANPKTILLAQIEDHNTEVFYCMDPVAYSSDFVRQLPGCVRRTIGWRAAPTKGADLTAYDLIVSNFPDLLAGYAREGCRVEHFFPAHDPVMDSFAANEDRPLDILFAGSFTRNHQRRTAVLEAIADLRKEYRVSMLLDVSRATRWLSALPIPFVPMRLPRSVYAVRQAPVYGLDLYRSFGEAKIVINGSIDVTRSMRGNMRCFESMGCGSVMVTDEGRYPDGMVAGVNMSTYTCAADAVSHVRRLLSEPSKMTSYRRSAHEMISTMYSKENQMQRFTVLVS